MKEALQLILIDRSLIATVVSLDLGRYNPFLRCERHSRARFKRENKMIKAFSLAFMTSLLVSVTACGAAKQQSSLDDVAAGHAPRIAADETGNLHVAFQGLEQKTGVANIFYTQSADHGHTWSAPLDISKSKGISSHPDIALEANGAIDMVWRNSGYDTRISDVYFSRSTDAGKTWASRWMSRVLLAFRLNQFWPSAQTDPFM